MTSDRARPRVVVDTNLFVSGLLSKHGSPFALVEVVRAATILLVLTEPLKDEYRRVLRRPRFAERYGLTREEVEDFLLVVDAAATIVPVMDEHIVLVRDPADQMVLDAALSGQADYLVTGDKDLLVLKEHPGLGGLRIVTAREFLDMLAST